MKFNELLARMNGREKLGVAVMAIVVAVWIIDWTVIGRVVNRLGTLTEQTVAAARLLRFNYDMLQLKPRVTGEYDKVRATLELPLTDEEIIAETDNGTIRPLLEEYGIQVESARSIPSTLPPVGEAREYVLEFTGIDADAAKLLEFMDAVNQAPGLYRISQVKLGPGNGPQRVKGSIAIARLVLRMKEEAVQPQ